MGRKKIVTTNCAGRGLSAQARVQRKEKGVNFGGSKNSAVPTRIE